MPELTDPLKALLSFQHALQNRMVVPRPGELDPSVLVYADRPAGEPRFTYVRLEGLKVAALVNFTPSDPFEPGIPCYGIGYAVHQNFRGQGRAQSLVKAAIAELRNGLARNGIPIFHIEAIVGADNIASQHVAAATLSPDAKPGTDQYSGVPIFQYVRKIEPR
ncbi:GNAT family N-acetyltransferase [Stenotrophomonas indicatrix]|uniref:Acetyltransferase (GNAT) family protein n=1 Tax=Stenotrophomonas indicatrix TaxID=2045451 RepID=A0A1W1GUH5_9GAMM|nr:GNAT family N-acetyltransferase [Stenotrophomonas indicatrix]SLM22904.1 Acetyltransferase (GNAT) family protein [Stenotrophomonas indicatrix]